MGKNQAISAILRGDKDAWVKEQNEKTPYSFNVSRNDAVWQGKNGMYTPLRARGATYANPGGIDAAWLSAQKSSPKGLLGILEEE